MNEVGRKFIGFLVSSGLVVAVFVFMDLRGTPVSFEALCVAIAGLFASFVAGNVVDKFSPPVPPVLPPSPKVQ